MNAPWNKLRCACGFSGLVVPSPGKRAKCPKCGTESFPLPLDAIWGEESGKQLRVIAAQTGGVFLHITDGPRVLAEITLTKWRVARLAGCLLKYVSEQEGPEHDEHCRRGASMNTCPACHPNASVQHKGE